MRYEKLTESHLPFLHGCSFVKVTSLGVTSIQTLFGGIEPGLVLTKWCLTWINVKVISSWDLLRHE